VEVQIFEYLILNDLNVELRQKIGREKGRPWVNGISMTPLTMVGCQLNASLVKNSYINGGLYFFSNLSKFGI
jgi:hypothetical protein